MKYAVQHHKEQWNRKPRRTRFVSLKMAKQKEKAYKERGFKTKLIPRSEFNDPGQKRKQLTRRPSDIINHWKFIPKSNGGMICVKNGRVISLSKVP